MLCWELQEYWEKYWKYKDESILLAFGNLLGLPEQNKWRQEQQPGHVKTSNNSNNSNNNNSNNNNNNNNGTNTPITTANNNNILKIQD